jgi:hypothetical protein
LYSDIPHLPPEQQVAAVEGGEKAEVNMEQQEQEQAEKDDTVSGVS